MRALSRTTSTRTPGYGVPTMMTPDEYEQEFAMSESNRLLAGVELSERSDDDAIEAGLVLKVTLPRGARRRVKSLGREDPDLVRLRKLLRKRFRNTVNSI